MKTQNLHFAFCSLSNKAVFLKVILIILGAIGFNTAIWAQSAFECFTMPANLQALENDLPMLTCATYNSSPAYIQKYRLKETYMPDASTGIKTFQIQFIVITDSNDPDALETYQLLKQAGNLLSDTVLIATALTTQMAEWKRSDILLDNAPLSSTVMGYVQNHVSTYVYDLLYAISYYQQLSARQVLETQINNRQAEQDELLHKLLDQYTQEQNFAEIENLLRTDGSLYAVRALVGWYVKQGNTVHAQAVLDSLPATTLDAQWFKDLQTLNIQRAGNAAFVLQPQQEAMLYAIAGSQSSQSAYAQALLSLLKGETFSLPVPPDDLSGKTSAPIRKMPKLKQSDLETLQLIPNPARTHVSVYIPPITVNSASELELFNQQGNSVCKHTLSMGQRVAKIDLPLLPKGIYVVHLSGRKNLSAKLVIE